MHALRVRLQDSEPWSAPRFYRSKRERDKEEQKLRILLGVRTHAWTETKREQEERLQREAEEDVMSGKTHL